MPYLIIVGLRVEGTEFNTESDQAVFSFSETPSHLSQMNAKVFPHGEHVVPLAQSYLPFSPYSCLV